MAGAGVCESSDAAVDAAVVTAGEGVSWRANDSATRRRGREDMNKAFRAFDAHANKSGEHLGALFVITTRLLPPSAKARMTTFVGCGPKFRLCQLLMLTKLCGACVTSCMWAGAGMGSSLRPLP